MILSIVTVSHRSERHLPRYIESFLQSGSGRYGARIEFIVVENSGQRGTDTLLDPLRRAGHSVTYVETANRGFGAGCNAGAGHARGDALIFANPDLAFIDPLDAIAGQMGPQSWGTVLQEDGHGETYAFDVLPEYKSVLGELRRQYRGFTPANAAWRDRLYPVGSFFVVAKPLFNAAGGFNERFFMYHEEAELARRLHRAAGAPVLFEGVRVRHAAFGSESNRDATWRREARGIVTYAEVTGKHGILITRAVTQALLSPVSSAARRRLRLLASEAFAALRERKAVR
jgi:GT2 family glycosyltransferase